MKIGGSWEFRSTCLSGEISGYWGQLSQIRNALTKHTGEDGRITGAKTLAKLSGPRQARDGSIKREEQARAIGDKNVVELAGSKLGRKRG